MDSFSQVFRDPEAGIACCGYIREIEGRDGALIERQVSLPRALGPVYESQYGLFQAGSFAVRGDLLHAVGGYTEGLDLAENTDLALRLIPECLSRGLKVVALSEPLVRFHTRRFIDSPEDLRIRLESARFMLERHGERYRRLRPQGYANYCAIAGVNAARLGRFSEARAHLLAAICVQPGKLRNWARYCLALVPPLARRIWLRGTGVGLD